MKIHTENKEIKVTKIDAIRFKDGHPMGVDIGNEYTGLATNDVEIGKFFSIEEVLRTTRVLKINVEEMVFETKNSVYKVEYL